MKVLIVRQLLQFPISHNLTVGSFITFDYLIYSKFFTRAWYGILRLAIL